MKTSSSLMPTITELLQAAIDTPSERRVLRPDHVLRREARERRGRKMQAVREQYGLN